MTAKDLNLNDCDFKKVDNKVVLSMLLPDIEVNFSGEDQSEEYFKYLLDNNLVSDQKVPVLITIDKKKNWVELQAEDIKLLSQTDSVWLCFINFACLVSLLKRDSVVSIEVAEHSQF